MFFGYTLCMSARLPISVIIISLNEEHNISRSVRSALWAGEVLVVDSGSTDKTGEIARSLGARVLEHAWQGYGQQKNYAMSQAANDWVFFLDADEEITPELKGELEIFVSRSGNEGGVQYWGAALPRKTFFLGRWILHGGWYPNILTRLAHRKHARWTEPPVHESLEVDGRVLNLKNDLLHYTFRDVGDQVLTNVRFSRLGARVAKARGERGSLFKIFVKPFFKFLETYFWKLGFLDGFPGLVISINAAHSMFMKYVELRFEKDSDR